MKKFKTKITKIFIFWYFLIRYLLKEIFLFSYRKTTPKIRRHDDLYLVSFPKSGVTWLSTILANLNTHMRKKNAVNFYNIHQHIPDIHMSRDVPEYIDNIYNFRIIKSHAPQNPFYNQVIYIVRDPRSVMVSYYYFLYNLNQYSGTISNFIRSKKYGIHKWCEHVENWCIQKPDSLRMIIFNYNDVIEEPCHELEKIISLLGCKVKSSDIEAAILASSFDKMKEDENELKTANVKINDNNFEFMRQGKSRGWEDELSLEDIHYIEQVAGDYMRLFGYELQ